MALLRNLKLPFITPVSARFFDRYIPRKIKEKKTEEYVENSLPEKLIPEEVLKARKKDEPVELRNPYEKEKVKCILCKHNIVPDYKNVRLLSQFVSRYTGRLYGRHITGLCEHKQKQVEDAIRKAQLACLMPYYLKVPDYFNDPCLYDDTNPIKPHQYL